MVIAPGVVMLRNPEIVSEEIESLLESPSDSGSYGCAIWRSIIVRLSQ